MEKLDEIFKGDIHFAIGQIHGIVKHNLSESQTSDAAALRRINDIINNYNDARDDRIKEIEAKGRDAGTL
jgi:hypothetical protein